MESSADSRVRFLVKATDDPLRHDGPNVIRDLSRSPKRISPVYVYDKTGTDLFERQCATEEYYLRRVEAGLLRSHAGEIVERCGPAPIIELGAGTADKTGILFDEYARQGLRCDYFPIDVDTETLAEAENVALKGRKRKPGNCTSKRTSPPSGTKHKDFHNKFARHVAVTKGYGNVTDELTYQTPEGVVYPFDTYNPINKTDVWEVKTHHEWTSETGLATAPFRIKNFSERILDLEEQRMRGLFVASRCGLSFRYAVDNYEALNGLRKAWMLPPIEYVPYPGD